MAVYSVRCPDARRVYVQHLMPKIVIAQEPFGVSGPAVLTSSAADQGINLSGAHHTRVLSGWFGDELGQGAGSTDTGAVAFGVGRPEAGELDRLRRRRFRLA
jgi:hypothetical protein